jgi:DNA-directed RNA polymerase specialized sigma subunit
LVAKTHAQRRARLTELTEDLSESDRLLLEMLYVEKLSAAAIAAALKIKKGAVYTRKTRLIQRLRQAALDRGLVETQS